MRIVMQLCVLLAIAVWATPAAWAAGPPEKPRTKPGTSNNPNLPNLPNGMTQDQLDMLRLRGLMNRPGSGGGPQRGIENPIIMGGGSTFGGPAFIPQDNPNARKSSKEKRAEARRLRAERNRAAREEALAKKAKAQPLKKQKPAKAAAAPAEEAAADAEPEAATE